MKTKVLNLGIFFLVFLTIFILSSCKKDETVRGPAQPSDFMVGTWTTGTVTLASIEVGTKTLSKYFSDLWHQPIDRTNYGKVQKWQNSIITSFTHSCTGTIQIKSDNTYSSNLGGIIDSGIWSLNKGGLNLTLSSSTDETIICDVILVDTPSPKFQFPVFKTIKMDLNNDSTPETIFGKADVIFKKQ
jgi:hypothetical protein